MKLKITTPTAVVAEVDHVAHLRAEDASGAFGILSRHADFLTLLTPSVVSWRLADGSERHCAVRGGVLTVSGGEQIAIATREAVPGDDLEQLEAGVLKTFRSKAAQEQSARSESARLQLGAMRRMFEYLRPERGAGLRPPVGLMARRPQP